MQLLNPGSVVDVGCGVGTWLEAFREAGVTDVLGIDGDYVEREILQIPVDCFRAQDLSRPFDAERKFDLAMSLEVGEHLPSDSAEDFVESLTKLSSRVLFSAAIPYQEGANHINEQWPRYWAALFRRHGYMALDCLRDRFWNNADVAWWYSQNVLLYIHVDALPEVSANLKIVPESSEVRSLVHPELFEQWQRFLNPKHMSLKTATRNFMSVFRAAVSRRLTLGKKIGD
jgi:SAM-dependent methyltransferase